MAQDAGPDGNGGRTLNEQIVRTFAAQFKPVLPVCGTKRIHTPEGAFHVPDDGWQTAYSTPDQSAGFSVVVYGNQQMRAFLETNGETDVKDAKTVALIFGKAMVALTALSKQGGGNG